MWACECQHRCDSCSGSIRGNRDYESDHKFLTYSDLKSEVPFETDVAIVSDVHVA
jgi:hypothetical protein